MEEYSLPSSALSSTSLSSGRVPLLGNNGNNDRDIHESSSSSSSLSSPSSSSSSNPSIPVPSVMNGETVSSLPNYESANYDTWDSAVYEAELSRDGNWNVYGSPYFIAFKRWLFLFLIGMLVGIIAASILYISRLLQSFKYTLTNTFITYEQNTTVPTGTALVIFILISTFYGILATIGPSFYESMACGSGIPEIKCVLNGIEMPRVLHIRTLFVKVTGLIFSVSAGLPVGREGPMIHSGAIVASALVNGPSSVSWSTVFPTWTGLQPFGTFVHHIFQYPCFIHQEYQNDREKRDIVACGTAAGVAAAFGAPLGGVLFAIEEGASFWTRSLTWRSFFSAMVAAYTVDFFLSGIGVPGESAGSWGTLGTPGMFSFGAFTGRANTWSIIEIPVFIFVGICGGVVGAFFIALNRRITKFRFRFIPVTVPYSRVTEVIVITAINALLKFGVSMLMKNCKPLPSNDSPTIVYSGSFVKLYCNDGEYNEMASLFISPSEDAIRALFHFTNNNPFSLGSLVLFFLLYTTMATITYGTSVPSGLFIPSLLAGSALGRIIGETVNSVSSSGNVVDSGTYALVGAAALLGGNTRMTISLAAIVLECTGNYQFALPLMVVLYTARFVGNYFNEGIYDLHIHLRSWPLLADKLPSRLGYALRVHDAMTVNPITLQEIDTVQNILTVLRSTSHNGFPVTYRNETLLKYNRLGTLAGLIERKHLVTLLQKKIFHKELPSQPFNQDGSNGVSDSSVTSVTVEKIPEESQRTDIALGATVAAFTISTGSIVGSNAKINPSTPRLLRQRSSPSNLNKDSVVRIRLPAAPDNNNAHSPNAIHQGNGALLPSVSASSLPVLSSLDENTSIANTTTERTTMQSYSINEMIYQSEPILKWDDFENVLNQVSPPKDTTRSNGEIVIENVFTTDELQSYIDLRPYMNPTPFTVHVQAPLDRGYRLFRLHGLRHLIVTNDCSDILGIITRKDLLPTKLETIYREYVRKTKENTFERYRIREKNYFEDD